MGCMHYHGWTTDKDIRKAKELIAPSLQKALPFLDNQAKNGDKIIQFMLGEVFFDGIGVEKNDVQALNYWKRAAADSPNAALQGFFN